MVTPQVLCLIKCSLAMTQSFHLRFFPLIFFLVDMGSALAFSFRKILHKVFFLIKIWSCFSLDWQPQSLPIALKTTTNSKEWVSHLIPCPPSFLLPPSPLASYSLSIITYLGILRHTAFILHMLSIHEENSYPSSLRSTCTSSGRFSDCHHQRLICSSSRLPECVEPPSLLQHNYHHCSCLFSVSQSIGWKFTIVPGILQVHN